MKIPEKLETEHFIIRPFGGEDYNSFLVFMADERTTRFFDLTKDQETPEERRAVLKKIIQSYSGPHPIFALAVIDKESNKCVGSCGLFELKKSGEAGCYFTVLPTLLRKGYATEFTYRLLEYAFNELKISRIEAYADKNNPASCRVAEKVGMVYRGLVKRQGVPEGWELFSVFKDQFISKLRK